MLSVPSNRISVSTIIQYCRLITRLRYHGQMCALNVKQRNERQKARRDYDLTNGIIFRLRLEGTRILFCQRTESKVLTCWFLVGCCYESLWSSFFFPHSSCSVQHGPCFPSPSPSPPPIAAFPWIQAPWANIFYKSCQHKRNSFTSHNNWHQLHNLLDFLTATSYES